MHQTLSELGERCHLTGDCVKGLVCGQEDTCTAPKNTRDVSTALRCVSELN